MADRRVLTLSNLDFEAELAAGPGYRPPPVLAEVSQRWRHLLRLLPHCREAECLEPDILRSRAGLDAVQGIDRLEVWGVTPSTLRLAEQLGLFQDAPGLEVVRQVNDKRYSHSLEQELGIALPHSGLVDSLERLEEAVRDCPHDWVLKHPMGFSARERAVGKCGTISPSAAGWAGKKLRQGWSLIFEPWIYERRDFSVHFEIGADGRPTFLGWCELVGDLGGAYRGNRVSPAASLPEGVGASVRQAVERVAALGYRGLVGVDGFAGSWEGHSLLRPLVEINARCSFGRLALALADWLPAGWSYLWWHPRTADSLPSYPSLPPGGTKEPGLYALPALVDPEGRSRTVVAVAPSLPELEQLELLLRPGLAGR